MKILIIQTSPFHTASTFLVNAIYGIIPELLGKRIIGEWTNNFQDFFTEKPDYTPYTLEKHDERVFDVEKAMKKYNRPIDWRKILQGPDMDDVDEIRKNHYLPTKGN